MNANSWLLASSICFGLTVAAAYPLLMRGLDLVNGWLTRDLRARARQLGLAAADRLVWMRWWWGLVVIVGLLLGVVFRMPPVAALVCLLLATVPRHVLSWLAERQRIQMRDQMVSSARSLASQFRAGLPLAEGLRSVARDAPLPIRRELQRCVDDFASGAVLAEVLTEFKSRLNIDAVSLFVVTLLSCEKRGGKVPEAMEKISQSLEELQKVERKRESVTAGGRTLVVVLSLFPPGFGLLFYLIDPRSTSLIFTTQPGQLLVCGMIVLTYASVRWANGMIAAIE